MKTLQPGLIRLLAGAAVTIGLPGSAHAYLDPGTGSMMLQALIGAVAAGGVAIGLYWGKVKAFFGRKRRDELEEKDPQSTNE